jgi:hypothetical protein
MGNFIAKRWTYIDDTVVFIDYGVPGPVAGPYYINATKLPTDPDSETAFEYLSADGDPTQEFVTAIM